MSSGYTIVRTEAPAPTFDLTVVTVCRNVLPALKRTVASVLGQKATFPHLSIEHVVVDGASTDGTPAWLQEMKEAGKIETAISEPDKGIYDAMNKGINLARGAAVLFLNADDTFTHEDLTPCVMPILRGEVQSTAALTLRYSYSEAMLVLQDTASLYLNSPFCHQAFFTSARILRELGGFDSEHMRCSCDLELMYQVIEHYGLPKMFNTVVSNMPIGGFSTYAADMFFDEHLELLYRHRRNIIRRCTEIEEYRVLVLSRLMQYSLVIDAWQKHHRRIPEHVLQLREIGLMMVNSLTDKKQQRAARAAVAYLDTLIKEEKPSLWRTLILLCHYRANSIPLNSPFRSFMLGCRPLLRKLMAARKEKYRD